MATFSLKFTRRGLTRHHTLPLHHQKSKKKRRLPNRLNRKSPNLDYSSDCSTSTRPDSSTQTSNSEQSISPMLEKGYVGRIVSRNAQYQTPRRIVSGICWCLIFMLVGFILYLMRMSSISRNSVLQHRPISEPPQWESFPLLTRYYGGIRTLMPASMSEPEYPIEENLLSFNTSTHVTDHVVGDEPTSKLWNAYGIVDSNQYSSDHLSTTECFLDKNDTISIPTLRYFDGRTDGFPSHVMGTYVDLGIPGDVCFDARGRLEPYRTRRERLHTDDSEISDPSVSAIPSNVDWDMAQRRCLDKNKQRFVASRNDTTNDRQQSEMKSGVSSEPDSDGMTASHGSLSRTAVVVRTWDKYDYKEENILYLRSLIVELSLASRGEYDVHLLVQVQDDSVAIWADKSTYRSYLQKVVPEEFWGIATLWTESQNHLFYPGLEETWARGPDLPVYGVYRGLTMPLQIFALDHPEYNFFWQWEMDVRYTGHYYTLFNRIDKWTTAQPRKGLWERNGRFYIPAVHGTWEEFVHMTRIQSEQSTDTINDMWPNLDGTAVHLQPDESIWGPLRPAESDQLETELEIMPPTGEKVDKYKWGVGEAADLITLNPMFDPEGTTWGLVNDMTGYNRSDGLPARRAASICSVRLSRQLLLTMHRETAFKKHHAFPEMWPATAALHHGYKAVYAPHPVFVDRAWPLGHLAATMNAGKRGATGGSRASVFGDPEHNFRGTTWYYNAAFAGDLWKRWLKPGGNSIESEDQSHDRQAQDEGRMCLPPMLLHPVKNVELDEDFGG